MEIFVRAAIVAVLLFSLALGVTLWLTPEADYLLHLQQGEISHIKDVPAYARTTEVYREWVKLAPGNIHDVPADEIGKVLGEAFAAHLDGDLHMIAESTYMVDPELLVPYAEQLLNRVPGLLYLMPRYHQTSERLERALAESPYWGLLASTGATCNTVHAVPLEVWASAASKVSPSDIGSWMPNHIREQLGYDELGFKLVED